MVIERHVASPHDTPARKFTVPLALGAHLVSNTVHIAKRQFRGMLIPSAEDNRW